MTYRLPRWALLVSLVAMTFTGARAGSVATDIGEATVASYEEVDVAQFQQSVFQAAADGAPWVEDALQIGLKFLGPFEGRSQFISRRYDSAEAARKAEITVIDDGYLDDSVRGAWYRLMFERSTQSAWTMTTAHRAWRCWPGRGHEDFSDQPCL